MRSWGRGGRQAGGPLILGQLEGRCWGRWMDKVASSFGQGTRHGQYDPQPTAVAVFSFRGHIIWEIFVISCQHLKKKKKEMFYNIMKIWSVGFS